MQTRCFILFLGALAALTIHAQENAPAPADAAPVAQTGPSPPPAAPPKRSAADLEKLLAPIALYPDNLIATILPASVYPVEIVQAARFVKDTNNIPKLDEQPWDVNVKAVAMIPAVIEKLDVDLPWTVELGQAFLEQDKDVMDAIQSLRAKAEQAGTLKTTPQQVVVVTNTIIEKTIEQKVVYVTNTIVQIQPANPQIIYVPTYNPYTIYYPPPVYVGPPPILTFAAGVAVGAIIANNCNWGYGGIYVGHHGAVVWGGGGYHGYGNVNVNVNRNVNINQNVNINTGARPTPYGSAAGAPTKWQPDSSRLTKSGVPSSASTYKGSEARGWSSAAGTATARPATTATPSARQTPASAATRPSASPTASRPATAPNSSRPATTSPSVSRPSAPSSAPRPSPTPASSATRPSTSSGASKSAFEGVNSGSAARNYSNRGSGSSSGGGAKGGRR